FAKRGTILIPKSAVSEDQLLELALDAGAEDVKTEDEEYFDVVTLPEEFEKVRDAIQKANLPIEEAKLAMVPGNLVAISEQDSAKLEKLLETIEDQDDVQNVFTNADLHS